ncbi:DUF4238 domain-containing protein [Streptomyces roseifaciens]
MSAIAPGGRSAEGDRFWSRVKELLPEADRCVVRQHVVSQVLLRRFATPGPRGSGLQIYPFDLNHPRRLHKPKGTRAFGWVEHFVPFASASLEELWGQTEQQLPSVFAALDHDTVFEDPQHDSVMRDLIALHWVRSHHYLALYHQVFAEFYERGRNWLTTDGQALLRAAALEKNGLHIAGPQGLEHIADQLLQPTKYAYDTGALLRVRIEEMFQKVRAYIARSGLEIAMPEVGEFLIGDTPAQTLRPDGPLFEYGMALGEARTVVLPLGPKHMVALGKHNRKVNIPKPFVDRMNALQVAAAHQHVFLRPRSGLQNYVQAMVENRSASQ